MRKVYRGDFAGVEDRNLQRVKRLCDVAWANRVRGRNLADVGGIPVHVIVLHRAQAVAALGAQAGELRDSSAGLGGSGG